MTAESPRDNIIRVSARKRKRKRYPDDSEVRYPLCFLPILLRTNLGEQSADESTANRAAESPADEPPRKRKRGRPRKITEGWSFMSRRIMSCTSYAD